MASVEVVLPVYNEEQVLGNSVTQLHSFLQQLAWQWTILIADNGSNDNTLALAQGLAQKYPRVKVMHLPEKGRGRALRQALLQSQADIVCYMDIDLSTDIKALPSLLRAIVEEGYDIAIGSRLLPASRVQRSLKREVTSRLYNLLVRMFFRVTFKDAQCGFKALSHRSVVDLVPLVQNQAWFFDTELLILAGRNGYRIRELPVQWAESERSSRVRVFKTSLEFLRGLLRLRFQPLPRPKGKEAPRRQP